MKDVLKEISFNERMAFARKFPHQILDIMGMGAVKRGGIRKNAGRKKKSDYMGKISEYEKVTPRP